MHELAESDSDSELSYNLGLIDSRNASLGRPMGAQTILTDVSILFVVATVWNDLKEQDRLTPARRTWLSVAGIFALVSALLQLFHR